MVIVENVLWVVVLIGIMIMIHELGHYWAARFFDVRVEAFSFGFGPRLFGFRRGETDFRVSLVLFGGYVKMAGEQLGDENADDPRSFLAKPRWQRLIIAMAGPFMNIVLAVVVLAGLFMFQYPEQTPGRIAGVVGYVTPGSAAGKAGVQVGDRIVSIDGVRDPNWEDILMKEVAGAGRDLAVMIERSGKRIPMVIRPVLDERFGGVAGWTEELEIQIATVQPGMDAERAGLKRGDVLVSVNGKRAGSVHAVIEIIKNSGGAPVEIVYLRDGKENRVHVQPALAKDRGQERYMIGVQMSPRVTFVRLPPDEAFRQSLRHNANNATLIYQFLQGIVERRMSPKQLEGPIRIAQLAGDTAREGPAAFIGLMSMVSLNLAIFNLLPIPILDGGVILLLLVEMLMRRDLSLRVKETVIKLGFVFLMALLVFVLYNDVTKVLPPG